MKKLVALILTLAMMLCVGTAFAAEAEPEQTGAIEINWADLEGRARRRLLRAAL